jgi:hypothetical protein
VINKGFILSDKQEKHFIYRNTRLPFAEILYGHPARQNPTGFDGEVLTIAALSGIWNQATCLHVI